MNLSAKYSLKRHTLTILNTTILNPAKLKHIQYVYITTSNIVYTDSIVCYSS